MHRKTAVDLRCAVAMAVAHREGTVTMAASRVMDKTDSPCCLNKDGIQIRKGKIFMALL